MCYNDFKEDHELTDLIPEEKCYNDFKEDHELTDLIPEDVQILSRDYIAASHRRPDSEM